MKSFQKLSANFGETFSLLKAFSLFHSFSSSLSSGWIHFSELNGYDNTLLNRNFKQTLKALAPSINEIISKKIIEKYSFVPNLFNDAF
jgi:hypothetical protein